jgi:hypothetical protein
MPRTLERWGMSVIKSGWESGCEPSCQTANTHLGIVSRAARSCGSFLLNLDPCFSLQRMAGIFFRSRLSRLSQTIRDQCRFGKRPFGEFLVDVSWFVGYRYQASANQRLVGLTALL